MSFCLYPCLNNFHRTNPISNSILLCFIEIFLLSKPLMSHYHFRWSFFWYGKCEIAFTSADFTLISNCRPLSGPVSSPSHDYLLFVVEIRSRVLKVSRSLSLYSSLGAQMTQKLAWLNRIHNSLIRTHCCEYRIPHTLYAMLCVKGVKHFILINFNEFSLRLFPPF